MDVYPDVLGLRSGRMGCAGRWKNVGGPECFKVCDFWIDKMGAGMSHYDTYNKRCHYGTE
jgi:hypothetical protein